MTNIHGVAWVILGLFVWFYTSFIEGRMNGDSLPLFRWVAIIFLVWGGIRLTMQYWLRREEKPKAGPPPRQHHPQSGHGSPHQTHQHVRNPHGSPHQTHSHVKPHQHPGHTAHREGFKKCPHCHHPVRQQAHACQFCHNRV